MNPATGGAIGFAVPTAIGGAFTARRKYKYETDIKHRDNISAKDKKFFKSTINQPLYAGMALGVTTGLTGAMLADEVAAVKRKKKLEDDFWESFNNRQQRSSNYRNSWQDDFKGWKEDFEREWRRYSSSGGRKRSRAYNTGSTSSTESILKKWGVPDGADPKAVKSIFRQRVKKFHPDRGGSDAAMKELNSEADVLRSMGKMAHLLELGFHKS